MPESSFLILSNKEPDITSCSIVKPFCSSNFLNLEISPMFITPKYGFSEILKPNSPGAFFI